MIDKNTRSDQAAMLRQQAEALAQENAIQSPENIASLTPAEIEQMLHELRVHQIELEMQNTELRRTQGELDAARERYFDLYDLAPVGYCTISEQGLILEANLTVATLLGVVRGVLVMQLFSRFIFSEDQDIYYHHRRLLFETGMQQVCELRLNRSAGAPFWARMDATLVQDADGAAVCRVTLSDITERKQAEADRQAAELYKSEEKYRQLVEGSPGVVYIFSDRRGGIYYSPRVVQVLGYALEAFDARPNLWNDSIHPDDREMVQRVIYEFEAGKPFDIEYRIRHAQGEWRWLHDRSIGRYVQADEVLVYGLATDITERKRTEEDLRLFRALVENSEEAIAISDLDGQLIYINPAHEKLFGRSLEEACQCNYRDYYPPESVDILNREVAPALACGESWIGEMDVFDAHGRRFALWERAGSIDDAQGQALFNFGLMHDISERKQAEERLSELERTLRQVFQASPAAMVITFPETGLIVDANEAYLTLFGYTTAEMVGKTSRALNLFESWDERQSMIAEAMRQEIVRNKRSGMRRKDGSPLTCLVSIETIQYQGQTCLLSALVDISEMEMVHETLLAAQKMAGLGTLAAGVAHEMNSPLQVITGAVDGLLRALKKGAPVDLKRLESSLEQASRNSWRIAEIVRALSLYAHPIRMRTQPCDINQLVRDSVLLTKNRFKTTGIRFQFVLGEGLPALDCDPGDVVQALANLLNNAGDALPYGGQITLSSAYDAAQETICVTVKDNGLGILKENLDKIFDPFFTTQPAGRGVGLGLSMVLGVVRKCGGRIEVNSVPGEGSAFHLYFPLKNSVPDAERYFTADGRYADK